MPRRALSQEAVEQQRERTIRAALDLFMQEGLDGVSVRSVANAMGVSAMALYRYFPNGKEELLATIRGGGFEELRAELERSTAGEDGPIEAILASVHALTRFALRQPGLYRLMFDVTQTEESDPYLALRRKRAWEQASAPFEAAWREGLLRGEREMLAHLVFAAVHGVICFELSGQPNPHRRLNRLMGPLLETLFLGLGAKPETMRKVRRRFSAAKSKEKNQ